MCWLTIVPKVVRLEGRIRMPNNAYTCITQSRMHVAPALGSGVIWAARVAESAILAVMLILLDRQFRRVVCAAAGLAEVQVASGW